MQIIYKPTGKAREYAELACNIYKGCEHRCKYCFAPNIFKESREKYYSDVNPKEDPLSKLDSDCKKLKSDPRRFLSLLSETLTLPKKWSMDIQGK